jgi:hypothetical protein
MTDGKRTIRLTLQSLEGRDIPGVTAGSTAPASVPAVVGSTSMAMATAKAAAAPAPAPASGTSTVANSRRHYSHIRVAMLAYSGTPVGTLEKKLLRESVDLVVPNISFLKTFDQLATGTPQMIYTNVTNIYGELLTDWNAYADQNRLGRESAFYHVKQATAFSGDSGSSKPVNWFWGVYRGSDSTSWTDFGQKTKNAPKTLSLPKAGEAVAIGYPETFREINLEVIRTASRWAGVLEYVSAVDVRGRPTAWKSLSTITDTSNRFAKTGQLTFDPPADWKMATVNGSSPLFYVRMRTISGTEGPTIRNLLGRDYVQARGRPAGTIPGFDATADSNRDGYLSNAEYNRRRPGLDARFSYESRVFYPAYGQMRFATNVADTAFRRWAGDYSRRFLALHPQADGLFVDNSYGRLQVDATRIKESLSGYAEHYGTLLGSIDSAIGDKWLLANTAGAGKSALPIVRAGVSYIEEFALRPYQHNWQQFEDLGAMIFERQQALGSRGIAILDTLANGGDPTSPRTQISSLAYYYLFGDAQKTMLMMNGGNEPASAWSRHWTEAVKFDVGRARDTWGLFAVGNDPTNRALGYKVYRRNYDRALVLYKPLSYTKGKTGTTADNTATTHRLTGFYRELRSDGTLGPVITTVSLRNGEGKILVRSTQSGR